MRTKLVATVAVLAVRAALAQESVSARLAVEWITAARAVSVSDTAFNPGNRVFGIADRLAQTELRPNLRLALGPRVDVVARPRLLAAWSSASVEGEPDRRASLATASWTELYATWRASDALSITLGRQNFQWGPAELMSPSNRIFHETGFTRDPLYLVRGKDLLRVNLSIGKQWSAIALADVHDSGDPTFRYGETFRTQGLVKLEYAAGDGASYAGLVLGARSGARGWVGGYGALSLSEGWSVYADASLERGSEAWYPVGDAPPRFETARLESDAKNVLAIGGVRYTSARGNDLRVEYVHDDAGYADPDLDRAAQAFAATGAAGPFVYPGLEYLGHRLALVSWRVPDLPPAKHVAVEARWLRSLTDGSGAVFVTSSWDAADALVVFVSATASRGRDTAEFTRFARAAVLVGAVRTW